VHTDKEADMNTSADACTRISNVPVHELTSEEDVKIKIMLPLLRALGDDDADVDYERRTGQGYVDAVVDRFPVGIVVETKSPSTELTDDCIAQLEAYVFHQHTRHRAATVAMLTNGRCFGSRASSEISGEALCIRRCSIV
jgi:predicted type IV restriction endonuclease